MSEPVIPLEQIDPDAQKVLRRLMRNGYEAYLVGGCVRDLLLGRTPKDFDVATSATPSEVRDLFRNCRIIGRRFRLAHVFFGPKIIETATFRANPREVMEEDEEEQGELLIRRDNVFGTAEEDARRRDFTINGLFYDIERGRVIDYVEGLRDLESRSVRTIGDPDIRFQEDPVRILRAIKFAARLGFDLEDQTYRAVIEHRQEVSKSAPPRVLEEVYRLLRGGAAMESFVLLRETGLLGVLIPQVDARLGQDPTVLDPYLQALDTCIARGEVPPNAVLLCALLGPDLLQFGDREARVSLLEAALDPLLLQLQVPRREAERARQLLLGQRRVAQLLRQRSRPQALLRTDWFQEAVQLQALARLAAGAPADEVFAELAPLRAHPAPRDEESTEESRRRRRRRRRRLGEREGEEGEARDGAEGALGDDEPVDNEEEALRAFAAALNKE